MLTQQSVQNQLNVIAEEISRSPGMYYELYSRLFSERVKVWIGSVPVAEANLIERVAVNDPDYSPHVEVGATAAPVRAYWLSSTAWDMEYD